MENTVKIGNQTISIHRVEGRLFVRENGQAQEHGCVRHESADGEISVDISGTLSADEQLAMAAQEGALILAEQIEGKIEALDKANIKYSYDQSPIPGIPILINVHGLARG